MKSLPSRVNHPAWFTLDHGFATAEFAAVLPSLILVAVTILQILSLCCTQIQIQSMSYLIAKNVARGELVSDLLAKANNGGMRVEEFRDGKYLTVRVTTDRALGVLPKKFSIHLVAETVSDVEPHLQDDSRGTNVD